MWRKIAVALPLLLLMVTSVLAQADCPAIVQQALEAVDEACADIGRNQACYGNVQVEVEAQTDAEDFTFEQTGDLADVADIRILHLHSLNETAGTWGVAIMKLQADLPDTLPGQNVTFLLFGDVELENATESDEAEESLTQSFYFRSGVSDSPCAEAPDSGILIQTPEGAGKVSLTMNGVDIQLGSTAYLQAAPNENMIINIIEGSARVEAGGDVQLVPAGTQVSVPIDNNLQADGAPTAPQPYDNELLGALPISLLERDIEIATALTEDEIAALANIIPVSGDWIYQLTSIIHTGTCLDGTIDTVAVGPLESMTLDTSDGFSIETLWDAWNTPLPADAVLDNPEPGVYTMEQTESGSVIRWEVRVISETETEGKAVTDADGCIISMSFRMTAK